jgi:hypothetical protein
MSTETLDLTLDTRTTLPEDFTCSCRILILSPSLTELPKYFLYKNKYVKELDMSKCINITIIPSYFCRFSYIEHIIWPPNIRSIQSFCLNNNICIQKIDLLYCKQLINIGSDFCAYNNITEVFLPVNIQIIEFGFCIGNETLKYLDLSNCIQLVNIGSYFCANINVMFIEFPESLRKIYDCICNGSNVYEIDFSECENVKIETFKMCRIEILKLYSIDNIEKTNIIQCENIYIYNITDTKYLDLSFIEGLQNVYLPEGEYCILNSQSKNYSNVKFWLGDAIFPIEYFTHITTHTKSLNISYTSLEII